MTDGGAEAQAMRAALETQRRQLDALRGSVRKLRESTDALQADLLELAPSARSGGVRLVFDRAGVLQDIEYDVAEQGFREDELVAQLNAAFAAAPLPQAVALRMLRNPGELAALRESRQLPAAVESLSADKAFTLVTRMGRPVEIRLARGGALLGTPRRDLTAEVVRLARLAAAEQETAPGHDTLSVHDAAEGAGA